MAPEIEREVLISSEAAWPTQVSRSARIMGGHLATSKGRKARVRLWPSADVLLARTD